MVSSVPIHPISCKRPGVELGPQKEQPAAGPGGRPPKSQERQQSPQEPEEGAQTKTDPGPSSLSNSLPSAHPAGPRKEPTF